MAIRYRIKVQAKALTDVNMHSRHENRDLSPSVVNDRAGAYWKKPGNCKIHNPSVNGTNLTYATFATCHVMYGKKTAQISASNKQSFYDNWSINPTPGYVFIRSQFFEQS